MAAVASEAATELLGLARELERRDVVVADELAAVAALAERAGAVRGEAERVRVALERLPEERESLAGRRQVAEQEHADATAGLAAARARVAALEASRRRRVEELERAEKEAATAGEAVDDARSRVERLEALETELLAEEERLGAEGERLAAEADALAGEIRSRASVAESTTREPGAGLAALEEWGSQTRSALFVARGTLEQERERIVVEANALGSAVLGEQLGGSSVDARPATPRSRAGRHSSTDVGHRHLRGTASRPGSGRARLRRGTRSVRRTRPGSRSAPPGAARTRRRTSERALSSGRPSRVASGTARWRARHSVTPSRRSPPRCTASCASTTTASTARSPRSSPYARSWSDRQTDGSRYASPRRGKATPSVSLPAPVNA